MLEKVLFFNNILKIAASDRRSSVDRKPCALGQQIFLRLPPPLLTRTTEFEVKNRCKSAEEAKAEHYYNYFFSF